MLHGTALLAAVQESARLSKSELVRRCGYVSVKADGSERLNFAAFYAALLEAKGMMLSRSKSSAASRGRSLGYTTKIHFNGDLMVGKAYTALLDLQPGDRFAIQLGHKQITLTPIP